MNIHKSHSWNQLNLLNFPLTFILNSILLPPFLFQISQLHQHSPSDNQPHPHNPTPTHIALHNSHTESLSHKYADSGHGSPIELVRIDVEFEHYAVSHKVEYDSKQYVVPIVFRFEEMRADAGGSETEKTAQNWMQQCTPPTFQHYNLNSIIAIAKVTRLCVY